MGLFFFMEVKMKQTQSESLSSVSLELDSKGRVKPGIKIYSKSNTKKDILFAKSLAVSMFNSLIKKYSNERN